MTTLGDLLSGLTDDPVGGFSVTAPAEWAQGRTLYGGANAALAARAVRRGVADLGPLRSLQVAFLAPAAGTLRYEPEVLRAGRSVTFVRVRAYAEHRPCLEMTLVYGAARSSEVLHSRIAPDPTVPAVEALATMTIGPPAPVFLANYELRPAAGSALFSGGEPHLVMWARIRDATDVDPESALIALADVLPPAAFGGMREFTVASTVSWELELCGLPGGAGDWVLLDSSSQVAADGYSHQAMSCFAPTGAPLGLGRQLFAVF